MIFSIYDFLIAKTDAASCLLKIGSFFFTNFNFIQATMYSVKKCDVTGSIIFVVTMWHNFGKKILTGSYWVGLSEKQCFPDKM